MNRFTSSTARRRLLVVGPALVLALAVAFVARAAGGGSFEVESFYPPGSPDYTYLDQLDKSFEATHPGTTASLFLAGGADHPNTVARWRAGDPPEVNIGFFGPGTTGQQYVKAGQVYDLTSAMNHPLPKSAGYGTTTKWKDAILPAVRPFLTLNGHYYAVPREVTVLNFFYNRAIFAKYGMKPPKTWAQFLSVSAKLKHNGVTPLTVTGTFAGYMQMYYDYLVTRRAGSAAVQAAIDGKRSFSSVPGALAAANDLATVVKRGYLLNGFEGTDFTAAQLDFFQGRAAMMLMGSWLVGEMKASIPSDFQLGTFPFPQVPGGKGNGVLFGTVNVMTVAKQSKRPDLGVEWLKYFSRKDVQKARTKYLDYISPYKGVPAGPKYQGVADSLARGKSFATSYFGIYGDPQSVQDAYQQPIVKLFFGKISPAEMVKEISDGLASAQR
jgi:raffinose/stachyose/melibiose transport system substrate-binding protein